MHILIYDPRLEKSVQVHLCNSKPKKKKKKMRKENKFEIPVCRYL